MNNVINGKPIDVMKSLPLLLIVSVLLVVVIPSITADSSFCAERTTFGAWCQNVPEDQVDSNYRSAPTSCEATSYCRSGTCYDSQEGICARNTPQVVCGEEDGVWSAEDPENLAQCQVGCCLIGNQAAFVTNQRCKRLSSVYSLEINFRTDIQNEIQCVLSTTSEVKGACVFEKEFETNCKFITKDECLSLGESNISFHEDFLCTASELATVCARTDKTTCVDGRDEVFFIDSCGNLGNIYDASKVNNTAYWKEIVPKAESCNPGSANADSSTCGNCDYYLGSTCKEYKRGEDKARPQEGDNICRDLACYFEGHNYKHGETWCADSKGVKDNFPGSRHFRMVCYNGDVTVEPCADYRQGVCFESKIGDFSTSACRANRWLDCKAQDLKKDCENTDRRDCNWIGGDGIQCVPEFAPGFNFWETTEVGEAEDICSAASEECVVVYETSLTGDKECVENCHCIGGWETRKQIECKALGDCGVKVNYIGQEGFNEDDE